MALDLDFERGDRSAPKGHALIFFRQRGDAEEILATYIVTLPVKVDVTKYIPPMFASQMQGMGSEDLSGFAFPPVPEPFDSLTYLRQIAETRGDDLIDGGTGNSADPMELLQVVNDIQQEYTKLYHQSLETAILPGSPSVNELLYEMMGDRDKLGELSKLMGKLQFAADGSDLRLISETQEEILVLSKFFPEHYRIARLANVAAMPASVGSLLAQLYLERCYKLYEEDYRRLQEVEGEISRMEENLDA